jgi:hypothetical protein
MVCLPEKYGEISTKSVKDEELLEVQNKKIRFTDL